MSAQESNSVGKLTGFFKDKLADKIVTLIPDGVKLQKDIKFLPSDKELGNRYLQPVQVGTEGGITFAKAGDGAFDLNPQISASTVEAQVVGAMMLLRSAMSYEVAAKASTSEKAFMKAVPFMYMNMKNSIAKFLEVELFYGQSGLGVVEGTPVANAVDSTLRDVTFSNKTWASGIWSGVKGHKYDFYNGNTKVNTAGPVSVDHVNLDTRTVTFAGASADLSAIAAGHQAYFLTAKNGSTSNEMAGLDRIITNTGVLHNIDASEVENWRGNVVSLATQSLTNGSKLTSPKIIKAVSKAVERGLDEDVLMYISSESWATLMADADSQRTIDASYSSDKLERGSKKIVIDGENGTITIKTSIYVKRGEAFIFPASKLCRIGASEVTFALPGDDKIFTQMANNAGYEVRCFSDQALFCEAPARLVKITDIDNSAAS